MPPIQTGTNRYLYLYTVIQRKYADGTTSCGIVLLDDTTTVIDGGNIITGSIAANKISVNNLAAINSNLGTLTAGTIDASKVTVSNIDASKITVNKIQGSQINVSSINIGNLDGEIGGRNLLSEDKITASKSAASQGVTRTYEGNGW